MKFEELSKERQQEEIRNHSEINTDYDWYNYSLDEIVEKIKVKTNVELSGSDLMFEFFSKGNSGLWIDRSNLQTALMDKYPKLQELDISKNFGVWAYIGLRKDDTDGDIEFYDDYDEDRDELTTLLQDKEDEQEKEKIVEDLDTILDIFYEGYNSLYSEYNTLSSDENIAETIKMNDMDFEDE